MPGEGTRIKPIAFIDAEINPESEKVLDIGCVKTDGSVFHSGSLAEFTRFIRGSAFLCGHNILNHDLKYLQNAVRDAGLTENDAIDTLYLSPLLFPAKPYHALVKDDKLQTDDINNPLNDSIKAKDLFYDEVSAFRQKDDVLKRIFYHLLKDMPEFTAFFRFLDFGETHHADICNLVRSRFFGRICEHANIGEMTAKHPVELAYCLALIDVQDRYSITPPWVLKNYPVIEKLMYLLRNKPCQAGCAYCSNALDVHMGLKRFFGFDSYRTFGGEPLQEMAVRAAMDSKSLLAVFPTGGGKSIAFQVPALMCGVNVKGLTVVISPLQSLMKDQVDNLEKAGIIEAVTINGLLDPIERAKAIERVEDGSASILYIAPESLRSKTIERILLGRNVVRFVIDEAHCFSSWGQDFRVDYLYIGDFIRSYQEKKNLKGRIPVSCFTATAKQEVIKDICDYFKEKLNLDMMILNSKASRENLRYKVFLKSDEEEKYSTMRDLLDQNNCPTIIYVSRTRKAYQLAQRLTLDGYGARPYHGKMDKEEKTRNQDAFINGDVGIMVATSAFGMGVDKKDVGMVIHYEISDSLENYIQEAGRAGRDEKITADCYILYSDEDLNKHFMLLNQTKLNINEIQQVWKAIRSLTRNRPKVSQSALEIARKAGWDDSVAEVETRVRAAIAALEDAGFIRRGQNVPKIFADSILAKNATEAIDRINRSASFDDGQKALAIRIIKYLIGSRSRKKGMGEEAESRVDYIADHLGLDKGVVIQIVNLLREERILADGKDLTAFIKKRANINHSLNILKSYRRLEGFLATCIDREEKRTFNIKALNEQAEENGCTDISPAMIKTVFNIWAVRHWIQKAAIDKNHIKVLSNCDKEEIEQKLTSLHELAQFILEYLYDVCRKTKQEEDKEEVLIEFSVMELKEAFEQELSLFSRKVSSEDIEEALFYLGKIDALKIEGGFMVVYNAMSIERIEDMKKHYKAENYQKLYQFYRNRMQQIHIVGEYARMMVEDYQAAMQFADDYFRMDYAAFLKKYFKDRREEITLNITPDKFRQLFGELSPTQLKIINDHTSKYIVVAAGPGSGKTRILVHKLASLMLMEDVKHEQMLMVTFSRAAATEFKKRLMKLIGNAANYIDIKTFHSYCFDMLGKVGTLEESPDIIQEAIQKIKNGEAENGLITKTVLVIDEAQDMDANEFELINVLMEHNEDMRVIAVGDDDQNIYEFRGASYKHLERFIREKYAVMYEMVVNYRSRSNIVEFSNQFVERIPHRLKKTPIIPDKKEPGRIKRVRYKSSNLITPLVESILSDKPTGSTCILTVTNYEALQVTGLLINNGMKAKLIQSNEGFNLYNLLEVRYFLNQLKQAGCSYTIPDEIWDGAKRNLKENYGTSLNYELCMNMIGDFEAVNPRRYMSDLEIFIRESKLEDFYTEGAGTILVSTIHKAKGREFDNVYLLLNGFNIASEENMRQLYVAMTRARSYLSIHYNGNYLNNISAEILEDVEDYWPYDEPSRLAMQLTHRDVWLDAFIACQRPIERLRSGDELTIDEGCCKDQQGRIVLKFSQQMASKIETIKQKGYMPHKAVIRFIVYWRKEEIGREFRIILPELYFIKTRE